jgi:DNA-binding NarL/FixJ family response regulator
MWLQAVETVLERANVRVVGKAEDVETALALVRERKPHLLVAEAPPDPGGGFHYVQAARSEVPGIKCIVLSSDDDAQKIEAALAAGAVAYVLKTAHSDDLASAVRQAFEQSIYLAHSAGRSAVRGAPNSDAAVAELTNRERQILMLAAEGHSNAQLARMLWVTEQTVKFHLSNVYRKINVSNRTEAARWAQVHGLLEAANFDSGAGESVRASRLSSVATLNGDSHTPARRNGRRAEAAHR